MDHAAPFGFLVVRTPLLPFSDLETWGDGLAAPAAGDGAEEAELAAALAADAATLRARLRELIARPEVAEALWVASPSLSAGLAEWRRDPEGKKGRRAEQSLVRYLVRMTGRATPFGLFSGCSLGRIGEATELSLAPRGDYRRHARLDMDYLLRLCDELGRDPELRARLRYRPNSSLYRSGGRLRYAEARLAGGQRSYHLVAVDPDGFLERALERAGLGTAGFEQAGFERAGFEQRPGGATVAELAAELCAADPDGEVTAEEAAEFTGELIESQLLVSDLAPPVTTVDALADVLAVLREHGAPEPVERTLAAAAEALAALDREALGLGAARYEAIADGLETLPAAVDRSRLFQVDMTKPAALTLGPEVAAELARGVRLLHRLVRPLPPSADPLAPFREAFVERWGADRAVPLAEALDEELGIGFQRARGGDASPLLAGIELPAAGEEPPVPRWSRLDVLLSTRLAEALAAGAGEIELTEDEVRRVESEGGGTPAGAPAAPAQPLPDAFEVMAVLAAGSAEAADAGDFRLLMKSVTGPSGARMISRFCHADAELRRGVEELLAEEERAAPEAVFAEIVHLPQGRVGNVLSRPVLRGWEIAYLGRGGAPEERRIGIGDLRVSVSGGRILLHSARLGKRVIPRLTSAHNYAARSQGLYRFLAMLQHQGLQPGLGWSWGPLDGFPFLPRVRAGRVVLARARWRIETAEVRALDRGGAAARWRAVREWRRRRSLPRWVVLPDGDNELAVDLENPLALDAFFSIVGDRARVELTELFPGPSELAVAGPEGRFVHELVVPFLRRREPAPAPPLPAAAPAGPVRRSFPPGSEWLYAKLYTGSATADPVLGELVEGVVRPALDSGAADGWFFIRYGDPHWHLRLRLHGDPRRLREEVEPALAAAAAPLLADGRVWKLQLDTYEREVERYGGPAGIALAERVFMADSEAAAAIVELTAGDGGADLRWRLALLGCARLLDDLDLPPDRQLAVAERVAAGYAVEQGADAALRKQLAARLRAERGSLEALLAAGAELNQDSAHPLAPALAALARRSRALAPAVAELSRRAAAGRLTVPVAELAPSFLHMSVNRLVRSEARVHEMVIYDFLHRLLQARGRRAASPGDASPRSARA